MYASPVLELCTLQYWTGLSSALLDQAERFLEYGYSSSNSVTRTVSSSIRNVSTKKSVGLPDS